MNQPCFRSSIDRQQITGGCLHTDQDRGIWRVGTQLSYGQCRNCSRNGNRHGSLELVMAISRQDINPASLTSCQHQVQMSLSTKISWLQKVGPLRHLNDVSLKEERRRKTAVTDRLPRRSALRGKSIQITPMNSQDTAAGSRIAHDQARDPTFLKISLRERQRFDCTGAQQLHSLLRPRVGYGKNLSVLQINMRTARSRFRGSRHRLCRQ